MSRSSGISSTSTLKTDRSSLLPSLPLLSRRTSPTRSVALFAEQGSAKSTTTRMLVDLIDPSPVPLRQGTA